MFAESERGSAQRLGVGRTGATGQQGPGSEGLASSCGTGCCRRGCAQAACEPPPPGLWPGCPQTLHTSDPFLTSCTYVSSGGVAVAREAVISATRLAFENGVAGGTPPHRLLLCQQEPPVFCPELLPALSWAQGKLCREPCSLEPLTSS